MTAMSDADLKQIWARWETLRDKTWVDEDEYEADVYDHFDFARQDVPDLLAEVERLRTENADMREVVAYPPAAEALIWNLAERAVGKQRENARLRARVAALEGMLREVEWYGGSPDEGQWCPICGEYDHEGHLEDCALAAALREASDGE